MSRSKVIGMVIAALVAGVILGTIGVADAGTKAVKTLGGMKPVATQECSSCELKAECEPTAQTSTSSQPAATQACPDGQCDPAQGCPPAQPAATQACPDGQCATCP